MPLTFEIDKDAFEKLEDGVKEFYTEHSEGTYRLAVEGLDPADEVKEALRKEREDRAAAQKALKDREAADAEKERKRLEEKQEFESLYKTEQERTGTLSKELQDLKDSVANEKRALTATEVVGKLTTDEAKAGLLKKEALAMVSYTEDGVKINGPDGDAWDTAKLAEHLKTTYPFLVDGSKAAGGGASGGGGGGATSKKFNEMSGAELAELRRESPDDYERLRSEYYGTQE